MPKIRIREFNGNVATRGFFVYPGVKIRPGEEYEIDDEEHLRSLLEGKSKEKIELVYEPPKRGRPKKVEEDPAGAE